MREGWERKKLGDICGFQNGFAFKSKTFKNVGIPVVRITNIKDGVVDLSTSVYVDPNDYNKDFSAFMVNQGDILIAMSGATTGKIGIYNSPEPCLLNQRVGKFIPKHDLNRDFLFYFLSTKIEESLAISLGAAQPNLSTKQIKEFSIPIPPLSEQKAIVRILDQAFAAIAQAQANIQRNIEHAEELFQSKLEEVFSQRGEGWITKKLGEIGKVSMCKRVFKKQTSSIGDIPFYKIGTFGKTPNAFITKELYTEYREKYSFPKKGDILISASGTIGRRVRYDGKPAYFQDSNIVWIDNDERVVSNDYLYHFYGFCDWQPSKGATISRLYNDNLRQIQINIPPFKEQNIIVQRLETLIEGVKELKEKYGIKLSSLEALKKSLLQKAFAGELTEKDIPA